MLAKRDSFGNTTDTAQRRAERTDFFNIWGMIETASLIATTCLWRIEALRI